MNFQISNYVELTIAENLDLKKAFKPWEAVAPRLPLRYSPGFEQSKIQYGVGLFFPTFFFDS
jgi:hypothetical protein